MHPLLIDQLEHKGLCLGHVFRVPNMKAVLDKNMRFHQHEQLAFTRIKLKLADDPTRAAQHGAPVTNAHEEQLEVVCSAGLCGMRRQLQNPRVEGWHLPCQSSMETTLRCSPTDISHPHRRNSPPPQPASNTRPNPPAHARHAPAC